MTSSRPRPLVIGLRLWMVCALGSACATTPSAPKTPPPPENAQEYYPLQAGWRWAYEVEKSGETILAIYAVKDVVEGTVIMETGTERLLYALLPDGIARKEGLTVGDFILRTPMRTGAVWPLANGHATVTAVGKTVTVPAGTFVNCAIVEEARTGPERVLRTTYAAGVGPVAVEYQVHDAATGRFETPLRATLRGVTRPGDDPLR
jgi:hypothetical protein